jgi:hypothetical protein
MKGEAGFHATRSRAKFPSSTATLFTGQDRLGRRRLPFRHLPI